MDPYCVFGPKSTFRPQNDLLEPFPLAAAASHECAGIIPGDCLEVRTHCVTGAVHSNARKMPCCLIAAGCRVQINTFGARKKLQRNFPCTVIRGKLDRSVSFRSYATLVLEVRGLRFRPLRRAFTDSHMRTFRAQCVCLAPHKLEECGWSFLWVKVATPTNRLQIGRSCRRT